MDLGKHPIRARSGLSYYCEAGRYLHVAKRCHGANCKVEWLEGVDSKFKNFQSVGGAFCYPCEAGMKHLGGGYEDEWKCSFNYCAPCFEKKFKEFQDERERKKLEERKRRKEEAEARESRLVQVSFGSVLGLFCEGGCRGERVQAGAGLFCPCIRSPLAL